MAKRKKVAILFSGGLDSTYLLYKNLLEGNEVTPYYVEVVNNVNKSVIEKQIIYKLYSAFYNEMKNKESNLKGELNTPRVLCKTELFLEWDNNLIFTQVPIWILAINYISIHFDEIQIGYVSKDDAVPYIDDIKNLYNTMNWLHSKNEKSKRPPKLVFPILKMTKDMMLDQLPSIYKSLIFSCENPDIDDEQFELLNEENSFYALKDFLKDGKFRKYTPCGRCVSCNNILNNSEIFSHYKIYQSHFGKIKHQRILHEYASMVSDAEYSPEIRELIDKYENSKVCRDRSIEEEKKMYNLKAVDVGNIKDEPIMTEIE